MLFKSFVLALAYTAATNIAAPILRREVPQEHSHENILILMRDAIATGSNPQNLGDPVFGLLGDAAAASGLGDTTDPECLQQNLADLAFTNAKAAGNVTLMTAALIYRALERNTGSVGLQSNACTSTTAANSEIAAISQHQDPASDGAAATNKAIVLALAQQIASIGGDPQDALKSGTFAPGTIGDPTAAGNTCDNIVDEGCINADNKLVEDATADEINAAVSGVAAAATVAATDAASATASADSSAVTSVSSDGCTTEITVTETVTAAAADATSSAAVDAASTCAAPVTVTVTAGASAATEAVATATAASSAATATTSAAAGQNLQTFTGDVGGQLPPAVTTGGRGFVVAGETGDFLNLSAALQRSCSVQHNACADAANSGAAAGITVGDCDTQNTQCTAA
ncbi:hypothetical protein EV361DRAFT_437938 [Lentinula raphanica]|uniref:Uncharacterized protein n=1 Tax=Lentinula raphanica TaxID=153919 RepID=A0AA38UAK3_9AGAR|nr:hypothetical protein FB446DRAFT_300329 [Lentinula raphanica]KAJ3835005.1 hypothetical protein F5878DRAFT_567774 [Lentinula raphanica]KAJ3968142.1 hypothetical protein EV361DRAFT_437938 [Lentinula raphanica]